MSGHFEETQSLKSILIVSRSLPFHGLGGMEVVAWDMATAFHQAGLAVTVVTTACPKLDADSIVEGIRIICLPVKSGRYSQAWWDQTKNLYEKTLMGQFDIVFSISAGAMSIAANRKGRRDKAIYVTQSHGTTWSEIVSKFKLPKPIEWLKAVYVSNRLVRDMGYRHFDAIVAVGPKVSDGLNEWPTRSIIGAIPRYEVLNGIDTKLFAFDPAARERVRAKYGVKPDQPLFLSVCRLHPQKGVQHGLDGFALALKENPNIRFLIAGSGPFEGALKDQVKALGLEESVIFAGAVHRSELNAIYNAADSFLFTTTRVEGLPLNVLEALACGLPVVVSSHIVLDGQAHQLAVNPLKPDEVAAAIRQMASAVLSADRTCLLDKRYWLSTAAESYLKLFDDLSPGRVPSKSGI